MFPLLPSLSSGSALQSLVEKEGWGPATSARPGAECARPPAYTPTSVPATPQPPSQADRSPELRLSTGHLHLTFLQTVQTHPRKTAPESTLSPSCPSGMPNLSLSPPQLLRSAPTVSYSVVESAPIPPSRLALSYPGARLTF